MGRKSKQQLQQEELHESGLQLCNVRNACWTHTTSLDGYGNIVKQGETCERKIPCGFETAGIEAICNCRLHKRFTANE